MPLPKPVISCAIPSIHDEILLQCRIYKPATLSLHSETCPAAAVIGHPYAPLGGSMDDGVVRLIATEFLNAGYVVCLFDFRGAGQSGGRTSWSGKAELSDFISVVLFFVQYLSHLKGETDSTDASAAMKLTIGGYSYGSLIASHLPRGEQIISRYSHKQRSPAMKKIYELSISLTELKTTDMFSDIPPEALSIEWSYLLVSPLLPPVTHALTLGSGSTFRSSCTEDFPNLIESRSLAIFGDSDAFTSKAKLRKWAEGIAAKSNGNFTFKEIQGGHFWNDAHAAIGLQEAMREWLT